MWFDVHLVERRAGSGTFTTFHTFEGIDTADLFDQFCLFFSFVMPVPPPYPMSVSAKPLLLRQELLPEVL